MDNQSSEAQHSGFFCEDHPDAELVASSEHEAGPLEPRDAGGATAYWVGQCPVCRRTYKIRATEPTHVHEEESFDTPPDSEDYEAGGP
jgi:hypothetical protein